MVSPPYMAVPRIPWWRNEEAPINPAVLVLLLGVLLLSGCYRGHGGPLDATSLDPDQDQWKLATYYSREAAVSRQKAQELTNRAAVYEQLFGRDSEWVTGTRLLAQFYNETGQEQERRAEMHLDLARHRASAQSARPAGR